MDFSYVFFICFFNKYSEEPKTALVRPILKKMKEIKIHNCLSRHAENILSNFISAYRKTYSYNHVLLRLIENCTHRKHDIFVHPRKTANYGDKSLKSVGSHIWNSLPDEIKATTSLSIFKKFIKNCFGPKCKCKLCSF